MTPKGCPIFQIFQNLEFDFFGGQSIGLREYLYKIWRTCVLWLLRYQAFNFGIFLKCWLQLKLTVDIFQSSKTLFNFNREFLVKVVRGWSWYLSYYQSQNNKKNIIQVIKFYMTQREKTFDLYSELKIDGNLIFSFWFLQWKNVTFTARLVSAQSIRPFYFYSLSQCKWAFVDLRYLQK